MNTNVRSLTSNRSKYSQLKRKSLVASVSALVTKVLIIRPPLGSALAPLFVVHGFFTHTNTNQAREKKQVSSVKAH